MSATRRAAAKVKPTAAPQGRGAQAKRKTTGSLAAYRKKRDLRQSGEPDAGPTPAAERAVATFVIQKHDATRLHYDLRLEMNGVLKSWAVPKGLPEKAGVKVLAVEVEDHPLEYGDFEGVIPAGNYGAGTVMLWDRGHYLAEGDPAEAHRAGHIDFALAGEKCHGSWTLIRMRRKAGETKDNWLLIKRDDPGRKAVITKQGRERSVKTGRTLAAIAADEASAPSPEQGAPSPEQGAPPRESKREHRRTRSTTKRRKQTTSKQTAEPPEFVDPMKALGVAQIPPGEWRLEIKFDGFRALAVLHAKRVELWSRNRKPWSDRFPEVRAALAKLPCGDAILDGEIVALDPDGRSRFQLLQNEARGGERPPLRYYLFDLLRLNGESWLDRPLEKRQEALAELLRAAPAILQRSPVLQETPERLLAQVRRQGLEGIIAKAAGSRYEPGRRSGSWLKCRIAQDQELVIGGFTPPQGSRPYFGAILVGYYEKGKLRYAGKVGTGFDRKKLQTLHAQFERLRQTTCPFADLPSSRRSRFGTGMTAAAMREVTWVRPELVAQIKFAEWTADGVLRHPVYLGLREDKPAQDVRREPVTS